MTITSTKSWKHYMLICHILGYNDIPYIKNDEKLCIRCRITGKEDDLQFVFSVDPVKMLVDLYCPMDTQIEEERTGDIAIGLCMINNRISHGGFYLDTENGIIYFRMTTSFYETDLNAMLFEYMLSSAADFVEEYRFAISELASGKTL